MIEINLIPTHLRRKDRKSTDALAFLGLPKEFVLGCASLFIVIVISAHVFLLWIWLTKSAELKSIQNQWQEMAPMKNLLDSLNVEQKDINNKVKLINDVTNKKTLFWSEKLNALSDALPKGVWFKKINFANGIFYIEGNAYSKNHDEINIVGNFVSSLKKNQRFMMDINSLELNSVTRVKKGELEIAEFKITVKTNDYMSPETKKDAKK